MLKTIRGTKDILPEEISSWQNIEKTARNIFLLYGYREIRTPLIEEAELFYRSLGDASEVVVQKQMFQVKRAGSEREGDSNLVLRPEGTAPIVRAYIEHALEKKEGFVKLYYLGPMFRAERPQKGRLRQFHHIGAEAIGSESPDLDVEIISLVNRLLREIGVEGFKIVLNSLGCPEDKKKLSGVLRSKLKNKLADLCPDCVSRFDKNTLRIFDCKNQQCRNTLTDLDLKDDYLCGSCQKHFSRVKEGLKDLNINYEISHFLVRGLDYYTRTVFEITHKELGSQDALGAGGRYDNLVRDLGGSGAGAIGFALGVERILLVAKSEKTKEENRLVYLAGMGEQAQKKVLKLLDDLRGKGIQADTDYQDKSLKASLRKANSLGVRFAVIIGEEELKKNTVSLKDMVSGEQKEIKQEQLITELTQNAKLKAQN